MARPIAHRTSRITPSVQNISMRLLAAPAACPPQRGARRRAWRRKCNRGATMTPIADSELIRRLLTAALLGAVLGFEREIRHKSAGLRTNVLIAVGSALFTLMSLELAPTGDPGRIAAP